MATRIPWNGLSERDKSLEQEEVIQRLKQTSEKRNTQYAMVLQVVIALSTAL